MSVVGAKVGSLLCLFFLTLLFVLLPIRMSSWAVSRGRYKRAAVSLASCFSGGILLGVALLHLLPEVREAFELVLCMKGVDTEYPITELTVAGGFLMILVFEQLVLLFHMPRPKSACDLANVPPHGCDRQRSCDNCRDTEDQSSFAEGFLPVREADGREDDDVEKPSCQPSSAWKSPTRSTSPTPSNGHRAHEQTLEDQSAAEPEGGGAATVEGVFNPGCQSRRTTTESLPLQGALAPLPAQELNGTATVSIVDPNQQALGPHGDATDANEDKTFTSLVLLAALSLHSLFEGLALGLQTTASSTVQIFIAILLHKCVLAFALGVRMVKLHSPRRRILQAALVFAVVSPLGAVIGIGVESTASSEVDRLAVTAVLQGLATGTFLFVTFLEVIAHEIQAGRVPGDSDLQMMRLALIVIGFIAVCLFELNHAPHEAEEEEHGNMTLCGH